MRLDLSRTQDTHAEFRRMVEAGAEDGPVEVFHDGKHCLTYRSLHRAALMTVSEEPYTRIVRWNPHPNSVVGPRISDLLARRSAELAAKKGR